MESDPRKSHYRTPRWALSGVFNVFRASNFSHVDDGTDGDVIPSSSGSTSGSTPLSSPAKRMRPYVPTPSSPVSSLASKSPARIVSVYQ